MSFNVPNGKERLAFLLSLQSVANVPQSGEPEQKEDKHFLDDSRDTNSVPSIDIEPFRITPPSCSKDDESKTATTKRNALGPLPKPSQLNKRFSSNNRTEGKKELDIKKPVDAKRAKIMPTYSKVRQELQQIPNKIRARKDIHSKPTSIAKPPRNPLISNEQREHIIAKYESGFTLNEISETLQIPKLLVERIVYRYKQTGEVTLDGKLRFKKTDLPLDVGLSVQLWINDDCNVSLAQLVEKVWTTYGIRVSTNTIALALSGFHYFFNRVKISPKNLNTSTTLEQIDQYVTEFSTLPQRVSEQGIVFLDFGAFSVKFRAQTKPYIRQTTIYIICAMNESGLLNYLIRRTYISKNCVREFVNDVKDKLREQKIDESVMIIGSDAHYRYTKLADIVGYYKCTAMFLPANASYLNPVEYLFENFKGIVRRANPQNEDEMLSAVASVPSLITATECKNYYELMWSYVPRCTKEEEISDCTLLS